MMFDDTFSFEKQVKPRFTTTSRTKTSIKKEKNQANLKQENQETIFFLKSKLKGINKK